MRSHTFELVIRDGDVDVARLDTKRNEMMFPRYYARNNEPAADPTLKTLLTELDGRKDAKKLLEKAWSLQARKPQQYAKKAAALSAAIAEYGPATPSTVHARARQLCDNAVQAGTHLPWSDGLTAARREAGVKKYSKATDSDYNNLAIKDVGVTFSDQQWYTAKVAELQRQGAAGQAVLRAATAIAAGGQARGKYIKAIDALRQAVAEASDGTAAADKKDHDRAYRLCNAASARGEFLSYQAGLAMAKAER